MVWTQPGSFVMGNIKGHKNKGTGNYQPFSEEKYEHKVSLVVNILFNEMATFDQCQTQIMYKDKWNKITLITMHPSGW